LRVYTLVPMPRTWAGWITAIVLVAGLSAMAAIIGGALFGLMAAGGTLASGLAAMFTGATLGLGIGLVCGIWGALRWSEAGQRIVVVCACIVSALAIAFVLWMDHVGRW
jgi:hypothetical protein